MHRIAAVLNLLTQLNKYSSNNLIRHECQNGILGGCFFILFDGYVKAMLQLRDIMMKSEDLKASAKNNTEKDFEFAFYDNIDDALIEGLNQNQDFFSLLLQNDELKKEVLGIFAEEIYKSLRGK